MALARRVFLTATVFLSIATAAHAQSFKQRACDASVVVTGGTAITAVVAPYNGFFIYDPPDATSQGIATAENICVDPTTTAPVPGGSCNGTASSLVPGQPFPWSTGSAQGSVSVNAATSGHKFTCVRW